MACQDPWALFTATRPDKIQLMPARASFRISHKRSAWAASLCSGANPAHAVIKKGNNNAASPGNGRKVENIMMDS